MFQADVADNLVGGLAREFLHLAMQVHAADAHLVGQAVDTERRVRDVLVDDGHHALEQFLVGRLDAHVFHMLLQFVGAPILHAQLLSALDEVVHGAQQDVHVEGLLDIGVGTRLQTLEFVFLACLGSEQHHGDVVGLWVALDGGAEGIAVHFGHHDVGEKQVGHGLQHHGQGLSAVGATLHLVFLLKLLFQERTYLVVVLSDDNGGELGGLEWRFLWCHQAVHLLGSDDLGVGGLGAFRYLLGLEMTVAEGDGYDELAPLLQVVGLDGAVVHLYQRAGEVEADARAQVAVVDARWGLVEPLEDALQFVGGYLLAVVADGDVGLLVVVGEPYLDLTIGRGELDGVGEDVDQHFVELLAVDPHGQLVGVVLIDEIDALGAGLEFEERVDVIDEFHHVGLLGMQLHHALVNLPQVHHLVDEVEDALGIAADGLEHALLLRVVFLFDEGE